MWAESASAMPRVTCSREEKKALHPDTSQVNYCLAKLGQHRVSVCGNSSSHPRARWSRGEAGRLTGGRHEASPRDGGFPDARVPGVPLRRNRLGSTEAVLTVLEYNLIDVIAFFFPFFLGGRLSEDEKKNQNIKVYSSVLCFSFFPSPATIGGVDHHR